MKTIEEFVEELSASEALRDELVAAKDEGALAEFLKGHGVDGTVQDLAEAIQAKAEAEGEITDDDAEAVAGGCVLCSVWDFMTKPQVGKHAAP